MYPYENEVELSPISELLNVNDMNEQFHEANNTNEQYMVLYDGNAEVIGNFRALNFYKASDINIKEDIRLLQEGTFKKETLVTSELNFLTDGGDPRGTMLKIDGVNYKFKKGITSETNRRFIGYIAQQVESVVPEAVQLIDGELCSLYNKSFEF